MNSYFDDIINYIEEYPITLDDINVFFSIPENQYKLLDFNDKNTNLYQITDFYIQKDASYDIDENEDVNVDDVEDDDENEDVIEDVDVYSENQLDEILFDDENDDLLEEINLNNISVCQSDAEEDENAAEVEEVTESCECDDYCGCEEDEDNEEDDEDEEDIYDYINDYCRININNANTVITVSYKLLLFLKALIDTGLYDFIEKSKENILIEMNNDDNIRQLSRLNFFSLYI